MYVFVSVMCYMGVYSNILVVRVQIQQCFDLIVYVCLQHMNLDSGAMAYAENK